MVLKPDVADIATQPSRRPQQFDLLGMQHAINEAKASFEAGGIPIGAALIRDDGHVLAVGHNQRVQEDSATLHAEIDCLENAGRLPAAELARCTMFTTLSPCPMCAGACVLFNIRRVVIGENRTFLGAEWVLRDRRVEIVNLDLVEPRNLMLAFIEKSPEIWNEDIGEPTA
ncbi:cytosine deaminase [Cylindrobasidium torrendii FP15055 ss-10]|uniref:Cytosine deaminase n=1 Tax=Cylindrobasidium torrendii FP15055 ss-10 TaxID=1314674 RepID=A0A0D7BCS3_9AGAR|nr:cytosine deaminase [Cylindrobasidium torrendii FP15055 ss-10]